MSEPEPKPPVERLPAWWGPVANEAERIQLAASEVDIYEFSDRVGFDERELEAFANDSPTRHRYMLCECLSDTRWAWVYIALDLIADRPVVLKISTREVEPEGRTITRLNHPNVVTIHDMFVFAGYPTIVLEWCTQGCLSSYSLAIRDWRDVLARGLEAGRGLVYCHSKNVIHGDLKPNNILITRQVGKLADFGISRGETTSGHFGGTLGYAPPERERGVWSTAGDVYSYAMTLESSLQHFEGLPEGLLALLTLATVEDPKLRPTLPALLADLEREAAAHPGTELLEIRPPVDIMERRKLGGVRRTIEKRRRQVLLQTAVMAMFVLVTLGSAGLAAKCMVVPDVERREPSIERAIELAEVGDPLGAWMEYHRLNERKAHSLAPADHIRLAESLLDSARRFPDSDIASAAALAEIVAIRAHRSAKQRLESPAARTRQAACEAAAGSLGSAVCRDAADAEVKKAKELREAAHAINHHN